MVDQVVSGEWDVLVAGIDCSTQATKVVVVDAVDGRVVATGRAEHLVTGDDGARETDPEQWWTALRDALAATGMAGDVGALSVAGQQHGLVVTDDQGRPLRRAPLWNDTRSAWDAEQLVSRLGGAEWWANEMGVVPVASFTATTWAWLRRTEPHVAAATCRIRLPHDWLTERLTGRGVTDRGDASGTAWWSVPRESYDEQVLDHLALDRALLPEVLAPDEAAGTVTGEAAAALGLAAGIPVGPGTGDNAGAALGLGLDAGTPVVSLGTSGTAYAVSRTAVADATGLVAGFADAAGRYLPLAATLNCTLAVDRVAAWLGLERDDVADDTDVVVLPYLDGERTPNLPAATGLVVGLRHDTDPREVLLAAHRGAVASLLDALDRIDAVASGLDAAAPIVLVGGGARGRAWRRVVAEMSGRALLLPETDEQVAVGAAVQAAAVATGRSVLAVARDWGAGAGTRLEPPDTVDAAGARARVTATRGAAAALLGAPGP